jgi:hypothetical protein
MAHMSQTLICLLFVLGAIIQCCVVPIHGQYNIHLPLYHRRDISITTEVCSSMSFLPIREPQNASSTDESSSGASDHDTDHHDYLINNSPAFSRHSDSSHDHDHDYLINNSPAFFRPSNSSHDHEHDDDATDAHPETPSEHPDPPDHVSEASDGSHMDWSPISPVISAPGYSGSSSNSNEDDANSNDTTAETPETTETLPNLLPLPTSSPDHLTHSHQQAMANRIIYDQILLGARFDPAVYTPVFLHDTLMLPGSLATVIGKVRTSAPPPSTKPLN